MVIITETERFTSPKGKYFNIAANFINNIIDSISLFSYYLHSTLFYYMNSYTCSCLI